MVVGIIGSRNRSSVKDELRGRNEAMSLDELSINEEALKALREKVQGSDYALLEKVIIGLQGKYRRSLTVVSVGCDDGIGNMVREICERKGIWFIEVSLHFKGERRPRTDYSKFYLGRNATVVELGDMFVLLTTEGQSIAQDMIDRLRQQKKPLPYIVFDEDANVVESNSDELKGIAK